MSDPMVDRLPPHSREAEEGVIGGVLRDPDTLSSVLQIIRGPFTPIASRTPGLRICEHLPRLAQVSDKFCVVRTLNHPHNDHRQFK